MPSPERTTISVYLTPDLVEKVKGVCRDNGFYYTKDGVTTERLGTGVVKALEMYFAESHQQQPVAVEAPVAKTTDNAAVLSILEKVDLRLQLLEGKLPASDWNESAATLPA